MSQNQIVEYWGNLLQKATPKALLALNLAPKTKTFLETVGLPIDPRLDQYLGLHIVLTPKSLKSISYNNENYIEIGFINIDWGSQYKFYIEGSSEKIVNLVFEDKRAISPMFVNSDIEKFLMSLRVVLLFNPKLKKMSNIIDELIQKKIPPDIAESEYPNVIKEYQFEINNLKNEIYFIDSDAIGNINSHYWSEVLFDWSI